MHMPSLLVTQWRNDADALRQCGADAQAVVLESCADALESVLCDLTAPVLDSCALGCLRVLVKISATADVSAGEWLQASDLPQSTFYRYREQLELGGFVAKHNGKYSVTDQGREAATPMRELVP